MSSRIPIVLCCVGAAAFACGPRGHNEASTTQNGGRANVQSVSLTNTTSRATARKAEMQKAKSAVKGQLSVHAEGSSIRLALHVVNTSKKRVELTFPSGQTYDFIVLDSVGREMWRWGRGRMFTQALRNKLLGGGETMDLEETWKAPALRPGRYVARATLNSENFPIFEQTEFVVNGPTIASR